MPLLPRNQNQKSYPQLDVAGGLDDTHSEFGIPDKRTPDCLNIDFNRDSIAASRGSLKFNNQTAPRAAIRTRTSLQPLAFKQGYSVPMRGYVYFPYDPDSDIGGDFGFEGSFDLGTEIFHNRRGRSFQKDVSFSIPIEERLYEQQTRGANAPAVGSETAGSNPPHGFDEGLDECVCILQKGGDRTTVMSWALAIVNVGDGTGLSSAPAQRASNYALALLWFDAPQQGESSPLVMRYSIASGSNPAAGSYCTQAFRSILIHKYLDPGKTYHVSVQLTLDSGSQGSNGVNTAWNNDGKFACYVKDETGAVTTCTFTDSGGGGTASGVEVHRGPTDSLQYLCRYGIRFSGRDAEFGGLGMRSFPWKQPGFIPYGSDCTAIEAGGFQMLDRSASTIPTLYPGGYTLTFAHTSGDAFVVMNQRFLAAGDDSFGISPFAIGGPGIGTYTPWQGLGNGGTIYNTDSLRNYKLVMPSNTGSAPAQAMKGGILNILSYSEAAGIGHLSITNGATAANFGTWAPEKMLIQCYRWNQRELVIGEVRTWSAARDYTDATQGTRRLWSLGHGIELDDSLEPDIANLRRYHRCDDSGGSLVTEIVKGGVRNGHLAPFSLSTTTGGIEGDKMLFMSGEGEAPCIDLSDNPVFQREVRAMLSGSSQGFAIEIGCVFTEAFYAIQDNTITLPDWKTTGTQVTGSRPLFVPEILSWDVKDPTNVGFVAQPKPLLTLTHRGALASTNAVPFKFPMGFSVEVGHAGDSDGIDPIVPADLQPFYIDGGGANHNRYGYDAPWVGKYVTIQIGVQSTGTADQYDVYIAMSPKDAFLPASGDSSDAEFAYFTKGGGSYDAVSNNYFTAAHLTIKRKDLVRSVITAGRWNCGTLGYAELQPRMLIDKIRVFGSSPPGELPSTNGGQTNRDGKLEGLNTLPQRELEATDMYEELGPGLFACDVTDGSASVAAGSGLRFYTNVPRTSIRAVQDTYLYVPGDRRAILKTSTFGTSQDQVYRITGVAADGSTLTLANPYQDASRKAAWAASLRLLAYTAFSDDIRDKTLSLGTGKAFSPGTTTVADVILTDDYWQNIAPITGNWKLRIYSPLGRTPLSAITPYWTRGLVSPRTNPITGIHDFNKKLYCSVQGSVYEADDRWSDEGPTTTYSKSLRFRGRTLDSGVLVPEAQDRAVFSSATLPSPTLTDGQAWFFDAWIRLDSISEYQTVLWVGNIDSDPSRPAVTSHGMRFWLRFNRGRPELVFGSNALSTGTGAIPEKGLFIATAATPIRVGEDTHIRFAIPVRTTSELVMLRPQCKINGKKTAVTVNATDNNGAVSGAYDWLRYSSLGAPTSLSITLGAARDAYRAPTPRQSFTGSAVGVNVAPNRTWGWMHSLNGRVALCTAFVDTAWAGAATGADAPDVDPFSLVYGTLPANLLFEAVYTGTGHRVFDNASSRAGTIYSSPFVSVFHELGDSDEPSSWAEFGSDLFVTAGGKPARIGLTHSGYAGVPTPTTTLGFSVERFPLWKPNAHSRNANGVVTESPDNDPVLSAITGAAQQVNHYDGHRNTYLLSALGSANQALMQWKKATSGQAPRYVAFKGYVKPRDVVGRQVLFAMRDTHNSGGFFVELRDGRIVMGWYDAYLKKTVTIDTGAQVFRPGYWHYIHVRKETPQGETFQGNWVNSFFTNGMLRRVTLASVGVGSVSRGTVITGSAAGTGWIWYGDIAGGVGSYPAGGLTYLEYLKIAGDITSADASSSWTGSSGTNDPTAVVRPTHDSCVVRWFPKDITTYTDPTKTDPLMARVGVVVALTISAGPDVAAGATLTDAGGRTYKVLWAHPSLATLQTMCIYAYGASDYTLATNITSGGTTFNAKAFLSIENRTDGSFSNCISLVHDAYQIPGISATGCVTQPFSGAIFRGTAGGEVNMVVTAGTPGAGSARCFHPDMVGMFWAWGSGTVTGANIGKLWKIVSVDSTLLRIKVVDPVTGAAPDFSAWVATSQQGGVYTGIALRKSTSFDSSKEPDSSLVQPRVFGHDDAALTLSGIAPFNGEFDSFAYTLAGQQGTGENVQTFQVVNSGVGGAATVDPIHIGTDHFYAPIFAGSIPLGRLMADSWAATAGGLGTFDGSNLWAYNLGFDIAPVSSQPTFSDPDWQFAPSATPTLGTTDVWKFQFLQDRSASQDKTRYFRVAFYDVDQDAVSAPGPSLAVHASDDDMLNPAGQERFTITNLGSPLRRGTFEVWLYMGLAGGDDSTMFRVARVPVGAAEVAVSDSEGDIATFAPLSLLNGEPPRCSMVASSGGRMFYGALESDPSFAAFSEAGEPVSINYSTPSLFTLGGGVGERLTMLTEVDGLLVAGKRKALALITIDAATGIALAQIISNGVGCCSPASVGSIDGRTYFLADVGVVYITRAGVTNLSAPVDVSNNVTTLFGETVDRSDDLRFVSCVYRPRGQHITVVSHLGEVEQDRRVSCELDVEAKDMQALYLQQERHRFSKYKSPRLSAIASSRNVDDGTETLIGGTEEGFLLMMDSADTALHCMSENTTISGANTVNTSGAAQSTVRALLTGASLDTELEGPRGARGAFVDATGVEQEVYVLGASGQTLFFDRAASVAPQSSHQLVIGAQKHHWESRWMDFQEPQYLKELSFVDPIYRVEGSGTLNAVTYCDQDLVQVHANQTLDLTNSNKELPMSEAQGYFLKLMLDTPALAVGTQFDIAGIMWRVKTIDQD